MTPTSLNPPIPANIVSAAVQALMAAADNPAIRALIGALSTGEASALFAGKRVLSVDRADVNSTLTLSDADAGLVYLTAADAGTVTIPLQSAVAWPTGAYVLVGNLGAGTKTVERSVGLTIHAEAGLIEIEQYRFVGLHRKGPDEWVVM